MIDRELSLHGESRWSSSLHFACYNGDRPHGPAMVEAVRRILSQARTDELNSYAEMIESATSLYDELDIFLLTYMYIQNVGRQVAGICKGCSRSASGDSRCFTLVSLNCGTVCPGVVVVCTVLGQNLMTSHFISCGPLFFSFSAASTSSYPVICTSKCCRMSFTPQSQAT